MTQGDRVKEIRASLNLTLEKFGSRLGVGKTAISKIEKNERTLTEQMKKAICREFNVDYVWLTTGEGEMFIDDDNAVMEAIDRIMYGENEMHKRLFKCLAYMSDEDLEALERIIEFASKHLKEDK